MIKKPEINLIVAGNLGRVDYITELEYDLFVRPDTCNPRFRVWFNFTVENVKQDQVDPGMLVSIFDIFCKNNTFSSFCHIFHILIKWRKIEHRFFISVVLLSEDDLL